MKRLGIFLGKLVLVITVLAAAGYFIFAAWWGALLLPFAAIILRSTIRRIIKSSQVKKWRASLGEEAPKICAEDGFEFRDLNKNGKLDIYEDSRRSVEERVEDLLQQMTVEEKAGLMFSPMMGSINLDLSQKGGFYSDDSVLSTVVGKKINTLASLCSAKPYDFSLWHNVCQKLAERTRLGIPITLCSDPRHFFMGENNPLASLVDAGVSSWPTPLGLAAARDEKQVLEFGRMAAQELRSMGIRFGLHPVADTATEPRWPRISETFGEDFDLNGKMLNAYVRGFQGEVLGKDSVACCIKHFPGGGPQKDGSDPHFEFGKDQVYPGGMFNEHIAPFIAAFEAGAAAVMPYYGRPVGLADLEEVGFNFNKKVTHDLLRNKLGFEGVVHTDYCIVEGIKVLGFKFLPPKAWGLEKLSSKQLVERAVKSGADQIGGNSCVELLVELVKEGRIEEDRLDQSCRRVLALKFRLGLFDNPYVDPEKAREDCCREDIVAAADEAMRRSVVLLKNGQPEAPVLPISNRPKIYVEGFIADKVRQYADIVKRPQDADFALVWKDAPFRTELRDPMALMFKNGDLDYNKRQQKKLAKVMAACPTIVVIKMTRPAVIPEIADAAAAVLCDFGSKQDILLEAIFGKFSPSGKLPFELPSSMEAVKNQKSDVPYDSVKPLYPFGFGLTY